MHNIKDIRKNYDHFAKSLEKRFLTIDIDKIKDFLDKEYEDKPVKTYLTKGGEKIEV